MSEQILLQIAGVFILGVALQWIAWRLRFPAILLLLGAGLLLGPGSAFLAQLGWLPGPLLDPSNLFGDLMLPSVSLAVALILFEGGLTLNLREHTAAAAAIWLLVTVGAAITCVVVTIAAHFLLGLNWPLAVLLGAILIVTGPTVIGPLLRHVRPGGKVAAILKWEGIVIDPIGAMFAIVVFEALSGGETSVASILSSATATVVIGAACGIAGAGVVVIFFRRHWVPDFLHNGFVLGMVLLAFAGANVMHHDSGLFATTLMGLVLANQRRVDLRHVMEFEESISVLLISTLFIVLGARLTVEQIALVPWWRMILFLAALIVVARPLAVFASTALSSLSRAERWFIAGLAPRGIVAASVASVFALRLNTQRFQQVELLVPITFATIIGTDMLYGLAAAPLARRLGLTKPENVGFLIAGAGIVERMIGAALQAEGRQVLLVDTNRENIAAARLEGLPVLHGSVLSSFILEEIQLTSIARFLALTANDEVNALAAVRYQRAFSRADVFQLAPLARKSARHEKVSTDMRGRVLFAGDLTYERLEQRIAGGAAARRTRLTAEYTAQKFKADSDTGAIPLFVRTAQEEILFFTADFPPKPKTGDTIISLAPRRAAGSSPAPAGSSTPVGGDAPAAAPSAPVV